MHIRGDTSEEDVLYSLVVCVPCITCVKREASSTL